MMKNLSSLILLFFLASCAVTKKTDPYKKYGKDQLKADYTLFRSVLEEQHPGLYWYTPKDSIDYYFAAGESMLKDSLNETGFRNVLSYVLSKIKCGHTTVRPSKAFAKRSTGRYFPLVLKVWPNTAIVTANLHRNDTNVNRGVLLTAIDNRPINSIIDTMFQHLSTDGYNLTHKYQTISNRGVFGGMYTSLFGVKPRYQVSYIDTLGIQKSASVSLYTISRDSSRRFRRPMPKPSRRERKKLTLQMNRQLSFDTSFSLAVMDINTFTKGSQLQRFFKSSFKKLNKRKIENLVIDLRSNGGGSVLNSNLLTRYIADKPFKIADSIYALKRWSRYSKHQNDRLSNRLFLLLMTHRKKDGKYHFKYYEQKYFKPKKKHHYNGHVYVLTGGNTYSASTLFAYVVRDQDNVTIIGEETGGGAYGNNAWLIPDVTLPVTKVRFRLPLFRLVIDKNLPKNGRGIMPEEEALPNVEDIRNGVDFKMKKALELIHSKTNNHY